MRYIPRMSDTLFLVVVGVLVVAFPIALVIGLLIRLRNRIADVAWQRYLVDLGFKTTSSANRSATEVSTSPGVVRKSWELDRRDTRVLRYLKLVRSKGPRSNTSVNRITEEIYWPRERERATGTEIILGFGQTSADGKGMRNLLEGFAQRMYGDRFRLFPATRELQDSGVTVVLVDGADEAGWPSALPSGATDLVSQGRDAGFDFVRFTDQATCVGLDRGRCEMEPKSRWDLIRRLAEAR